MNVALWIIAGILAVIFAGSGLMKLALPKGRLVASGQGWAESYSPAGIRFIGIAEVLGAIGLILPAVTHIAPVLVPMAAIGLAAVMTGAAVTHARRKELPNIAINVVLLALALVVAWGTLGSYSFS